MIASVKGVESFTSPSSLWGVSSTEAITQIFLLSIQIFVVVGFFLLLSFFFGPTLLKILFF